LDGTTLAQSQSGQLTNLNSETDGKNNSDLNASERISNGNLFFIISTVMKTTQLAIQIGKS